MGIYKLLTKRKEIENPAKFTIKNIKKFLQGNYYKLLLSIPYFRKNLISESRMEQYEWRRKCVQEKSPECLSKGECFCGCDTEGLIMADPACEQKGECFPAIMDPLTWKEYKREHDIFG